MRRFLFSAFLFLACCNSEAAYAVMPADEAEFARANEAYRDGQFANAAAVYESLAEKYRHTAVFFYNLGNARYRLGQIGPAIAAYEHALIRAPRDRDIRDNLRYMNEMLEYRMEDKRNWYVRVGDLLLRHFTESEVYFLALLMYVIFIGSCSFVIYFRRGAPWGWKRKLFLLLTVAGTVLAVAKNIQVHVTKDAIVMGKETEVRYGPSNNDQIAFRLGEGIKVYVVDEREKWSRVILVNGETGWMRNSDILRIQ